MYKLFYGASVVALAALPVAPIGAMVFCSGCYLTGSLCRIAEGANEDEDEYESAKSPLSTELEYM